MESEEVSEDNKIVIIRRLMKRFSENETSRLAILTRNFSWVFQQAFVNHVSKIRGAYMHCLLMLLDKSIKVTRTKISAILLENKGSRVKQVLASLKSLQDSNDSLTSELFVSVKKVFCLLASNQDVRCSVTKSVILLAETCP
jgi:hypothetical protein